MKRTLLLLFTLLTLGVSGLWADTTITLVNGTNEGSLSCGAITGTSPLKLFTSNAASGLAGCVLSAYNLDQATWWSQRCLSVKPSTVQTDEFITITAPNGFVITGFTLKVQSCASAKPYKVTVGDDTENTVSSTTPRTFTQSGLSQKSVSITYQQKSATEEWLGVRGLTVTVKPLIVRAGSRVNSVSAGTNYMIFDAHHSTDIGVSNTNEPRSGFVGVDNGNVTKDLNTQPKALTDINGYHLWKFESGSAEGQYYLQSMYVGQYYTAPMSLSSAASQEVAFSQYGGSNQSLNEDGSGFVASPSTDTYLFKVENIGQTGNSQYWNGNKGSFATWASAHPYAIYSVEYPDAAYTLSDINTDKKYNIANARGWWAVGADATDVNSTVELSLAKDYRDTKQQFAFIQHDGNYYLYSISEGKFAYVNGTKLSLSEDVTDAVLASPVTYTASTNTNKATYPFILTIGGNHFGISTGNSPDVYKYNGASDEGNASLLIEAGDFDPTTAEAKFSNVVSVTYKVVYNNVLLDGVEETIETIVGEDLSLSSSSLNRDGCTISFYSDEECTNEITTVSKSYTTVYAKCTAYSLSSLISSDTEHFSWFRLAALSNSKYYDLYYNGSAPYPYKAQSAFDGSDGYFWAFVGDPFNGFKIYNKATGDEQTLIHNNNTNPVMGTDDETKWYITIDGSGRIGFKYTGNAGQRLNDHGGGAATLKYYGNESWHQYTNINDVDYSGLVTTNVQPFIDGAGSGYFKINSTAADALASVIDENDDDGINLAEYQAILVYLNSSISWPSTGYYRIKSVTAETYMKAESASQLTVGGTASDASTIVYLNGSRGTYEMRMQGKCVKANSNSEASTLADGTFNTYMTIPTVEGAVSPGHVTIGNGLTATDYHRVVDGNVVSLAMGSSPADNAAAYWTVETASDAAISMNEAGDGNYYATGYWPFDVTISNATPYTLSISGSWAIPTALTGNKVPAGTPVLLKGTNAIATATINTGDAFSAFAGTNLLTGTYTDLAVTAETDYFLGINEDKDNEIGFYKWDGTTLKANRAYFTKATVEGSGIKGFAILWDELVDGIKTIENGQLTNDNAVYNLAGQRMSKLQRGVNIVNGKKVVVK